MATLNDVSSEESFVNIYCQNNIHRVRHPSFSFIQIHSEIRKVNWNILSWALNEHHSYQIEKFSALK